MQFLERKQIFVLKVSHTVMSNEFLKQISHKIILGDLITRDPQIPGTKLLSWFPIPLEILSLTKSKRRKQINNESPGIPGK